MKLLRVLPLAVLLAAACSDVGQPLAPESPTLSRGLLGAAWVTSSDDDGPGSFRAAVGLANANPLIQTIFFAPTLPTIHLLSPVVYEGGQDLALLGLGLGLGATLDGSGLGAGETNFLANGGGDLEIRSLTFRNAPGHGMTVQVPASASGTQRVTLRDVAAIENLGHGIEINDQEDADDAGNPDVTPQIRPNSNGSDASLHVVVIGSRFLGNGFGALDRDGLRVNEGGAGELTVQIANTIADDNGADGVELDERGVGNVVFEVLGSHFRRNGDFDQSPVPDKDDGFDVDEADAGDLIATVRSSTANDNFEEGWDFNENDAGAMTVSMKSSEAIGNPEEGVDLEEDDDFQGGGHLRATLMNVTANGNGPAGDGGIKIRERGDGDLETQIFGADASDNLITGIHVREQGNGNLAVDLQQSTAHSNGADGVFLREDDGGNLAAVLKRVQAVANGDDGIEFDENGDGDLTARVLTSSASDNTDRGIVTDEAGAVSGAAVFTNVTLTGNGGGATGGNVPPAP